MLFLDEPTSGLDSTTATSLCHTLKSIAVSKSMTVIAVVHQPSLTSFLEFDDLLLLGKGGRVVYHGALSEAPGYFASIGFPLPELCNPADFYLDVVAGRTFRILFDFISFLFDCITYDCDMICLLYLPPTTHKFYHFIALYCIALLNCVVLCCVVGAVERLGHKAIHWTELFDLWEDRRADDEQSKQSAKYDYTVLYYTIRNYSIIVVVMCPFAAFSSTTKSYCFEYIF